MLKLIIPTKFIARASYFCVNTRTADDFIDQQNAGYNIAYSTVEQSTLITYG